MRKVAIARASAIEPDSLWDKSFADLLREAAAPAIAGLSIDGVFCASGPGVRHQGDPAAIACDRLNVDPAIALSFDAADVSGAAALAVAWQHIRAGACETALVIGAAKVSDLAESERLALMDCCLDQEADVARGIDFATQAGLLAGHYCRERGKDASVFAETTAANLAAWARHKGNHVPTAAELRRDLLVAPPLVRSDFAQLLDGGCALVLSDVEKTAQPLAIVDHVSSASDIVSVWERKNPLAFAAAYNSVARMPGDASRASWIEIDAAVSVAQILSAQVFAGNNAGSPEERHVNRRGGAQGRGRVLGASALYQLADVCEIVRRDQTALLLAVSGLGSHVYALRLSGVA